MLVVEGLKKYFFIRKGIFKKKTLVLKAVDDVSFRVERGETFGLVGESGSGKTTAGRTILRLYEPTAGKVLFKGVDIFKLSKEEFRKIRPKMGIIYQDPYSSLNPRMTVFDIIAEPLREYGCQKLEERIIKLLKDVGLGEEHARRYPDELSGGQCQRVAIARALALDPELIVLDEPTSALDVSVQAQVLNLLEELQKERGISYLFISHDLGVIRYLSRRVGVMYLGKLMEEGDVESVLGDPLHPYTRILIESIPIPDPGTRGKKGAVVAGEIPSPLNPPPGCRFHPRCSYAKEICAKEEPPWVEVSPGRFVRCHLYT